LLFYDDTEHPLVRITIVGVRTREDNTAYMERVDALLNAGERFALLVDDRSTGTRSAQSARALRWAVTRWAQLKRTCVGMAVIVDGLILLQSERSTRVPQLLTPVPVSVFDDAGMADSWVRSRLSAAVGRQVIEQYVR
jgi:hypothetical protein